MSIAMRDPWRLVLTALLAALLLVALALGLGRQALAQDTTPGEANPGQEAAFAVPAVDADTWRRIRGGETDANFRDSRAQSTYNLINASGETWRQVRDRWVSPFGAIAILGMLAMILVFYLVVGRQRLDEPRTGRKLLRWPILDRALHWSVASLFLLLGLTGLMLLYGKALLRPMFGDGAWAGLMTGTKTLHNYLGPLFAILLLVVLARFLRHNLPRRHDLAWLRQGGGMVGKAHPDAGFANAGEKLWYWLLASVGLVVVVSGLVLDFPNFNQTRDTMQWANIIHALGALGLTAVALGHIYIGTLGTEGALEGMTHGYVDESWARQHHNLWYEEVKGKADRAAPDAAQSDSPSASRPPG
ncbi:formate dehydrogenase subunit gamma [Halomonas sp. M4R1S46]|uniref:formate dehydrogenase subunit gamma n=1 Tax=Halomonas sp. M4R1S46 TaxID=2982692 RepID=UPI0021E422A4|nr:formate dehydrogenase subunit gamma [Halomonas sp. M4R1S46]UYG09572.1 formate dehydrogenase subunit gamma [Halomonas sp. M4R1S46]